jgi:hypothetical protein
MSTWEVVMNNKLNLTPELAAKQMLIVSVGFIFSAFVLMAIGVWFILSKGGPGGSPEIGSILLGVGLADIPILFIVRKFMKKRLVEDLVQQDLAE